MDADDVLVVLRDAADAIAAALTGLDDWGPAGTRAGQYHSDLAADAAALGVLLGADLGVLSEESGMHRRDAAIIAVVDPLDGSTNASRGIPWFASSLCAVDGAGALASVVTNLVSGDRYEATRGGGARRNGKAIEVGRETEMGRSIVGLSGYPPRHLGWKQFRALGAVALDVCAVATGTLDGYVDCSHDAHGAWDYLGAMLICREAGGFVADAAGRDLVVLDHDARRTPVAAATQELLDELLLARATF